MMREEYVDELDDTLDDVEPVVDNPAELYEHFRVVVDKGHTGMGVRQGGSRSGRTKKAAHGPARRYAVHLHAGELLPRFTLQPFGGLLPETRTACKSHSPKRVGSERTGTGPATR